MKIKNDIKAVSNIKDVYKLEQTAKELKNNAQNKIKTRSKKIYVKYIGTSKDGDIHFETNSGTISGQFWNQRIRFVELDSAVALAYENAGTQREIIQMLMSSDILVYCNDPSFKYYGWQYMSWNQKYGLEKETRYPKIRNRYLEGTVCKHLLAVLKILPFYSTKIVKEYRNLGILPPPQKRKRKKYRR